MTLYELTQQYADLLTLDIDDEEAVRDTLEALDGEIKDKVENIAKVLSELAGDVETLKSEIDRLTARKKATEHKIKWLKDYLIDCLGDTKSLTTATHKVTIRESESVNIFDREMLSAWATRYGRDDIYLFREPEISKSAIKEALSNGEVPGAEIQRSKSITIK